MYRGDFWLNATILFKFTTRKFSTGAPFTLAGTPALAAYPDGSTTELTAGITLTVDFDGRTGLNHVAVAATTGNGYITGTNYDLVITAGTVDGVSVVGEVIGSFSIEARSALRPTAANRTLDVSTGGEAGVDWGNVGSPTTVQGLSGTTVKSATDVETDTQDIQARLPAALVSGRIDASAGAMAADVLTAAALAADAVAELADAIWDEAIAGHLGAGSTGAALNGAGSAGDPWSTALPGAYGAGTAGKIVGDNLDAAVSSRATQTIADAIAAYIDTEVAAIKAKTDQLTFTGANKLDAALVAAGDLAAAVANKIADHVKRRTYANARASADGDAVTFRSHMGAEAKLVNKVAVNGTNLEIMHEDDATVFGTQAITATAGANPVTALDTV
jgi:hypothetical protein